MPFGVWQGMVPFTYLLENGGGEPEAEELDWTVEQLSVGLMGNGEVEVKAVLAFNCFQTRHCGIFCEKRGYIVESGEKI